MLRNILLTGKPHSGKSTLLARLLPNIGNSRGFLTNEITEEGTRTGFEVITSGGCSHTLASIDTESQFRVSRYGVDIEGFETVLEHMFKIKGGQTLYLDEIGEMQLYSYKFRELVLTYLNSSNLLVATLSSVYSDAFVESVRRRDDVYIVEITPKNREDMYLRFRKILGV